MNEPGLSISFSWKEEDGDASKCFSCKDPIYYKMHRMVAIFNDKEIKSQVKLCDSCFQLVDKKEDE